MPSQIREVINRRNQARQTLMVLRAGLPAIGQLFRAGAQLVGPQALQLLALAVENSQMRPEELVAGAGQEVAIQRPHIDRPMRRIMHGVDERHRSRSMRQPAHFVHIVDRADSIGGLADRNQPRGRGEFWPADRTYRACSRPA